MDKTREFDLKISPTKIFTPGVVVLLVLLVIGFIFTNYLPVFSFDNLAISGQGLIKGKIWQLATYPFVNGCSLNLVFSCFTILFIGSDVERQWRTKSFLMLWLVVS
ncbi:MAG: rhomboid family intramembrane serine protease, partial [Phycisphaerae bacterium]